MKTQYQNNLVWKSSAADFQAIGSYKPLVAAIAAFVKECGDKMGGVAYAFKASGYVSVGCDDSRIVKAAPAPAISPEMMAAFAAFMASQGKANGNGKSKRR